MVNADGSIAIVEIQRGEYTPLGAERGEVDAVGYRPNIELFGRPVPGEEDRGAGSGGRYYDELQAQIRQEDELLLEMIEEFVRKIA